MSFLPVPATLLLVVATTGLLTQNSPPAKPPAKPAAKANTSSDDARRAELFASDRWRAILESIRQWASTTQIYTPDEIEEIRQQFNDRLRNQSPPEIEQSMTAMEKWLAVVLSPEAREANAHIARTLQLQSDSAAQRTRDKLPDVAAMTAAELERELISFNQQRQANASTAAAFNQARQQQIQMTQQSMAAQRQAQQQANLAARRSAAQRPSFQSPLSPPTPVTRIDRTNNTRVYVDSLGRSGVIFGGSRW